MTSPVHYERGKNMHLADTLSRAFLPFEGDNEDDLEFVNMVNYLPISDERIDEIEAATRKIILYKAYLKPFSKAGENKRNLPLN